MVHCSANPSKAAAAYCTGCGQPFSGPLLAVRTDGRAICHRYRPAAPGTGAGGGAFTADIFLTHGKKPVERGTTPFMLLSERQ